MEIKRKTWKSNSGKSTQLQFVCQDEITIENEKIVITQLSDIVNEQYLTSSFAKRFSSEEDLIAQVSRKVENEKKELFVNYEYSKKIENCYYGGFSKIPPILEIAKRLKFKGKLPKNIKEQNLSLEDAEDAISGMEYVYNDNSYIGIGENTGNIYTGIVENPCSWDDCNGRIDRQLEHLLPTNDFEPMLFLFFGIYTLCAGFSFPKNFSVFKKIKIAEKYNFYIKKEKEK